MTNQQHPITVPPAFITGWKIDYRDSYHRGDLSETEYIVLKSAQWGADQELDACCLLLDNGEHAASYGCHDGSILFAARRPKQPTLAEQATADLDDAVMRGDCITTTDAMPLLRASLARLAELEALHNDSH